MKKFLFSADLHGNIMQYEKLFLAAKKEKVNLIIIGGDLAPKDGIRRTILQQKFFFADCLLPLLKKYSDIAVYLIMGNDDFKANRTSLQTLAKKQKNLFILSDKPKKIAGLSITGYPYVPLTPFRFKDWEKIDAPDVLETTYRDFVTSGMLSKKGGFINHEINLHERKNSIAHDFDKIAKKCKGEKAIWIVHTPPYDTVLDVIHTGKHVGSIALKRAIEKYKPKLTLHGHIHETVAMTNKFKQKIGRTWSMTPGNDYRNNVLYYLLVDLFNPEKTKRKKC
ncbi:hypothetical protein C4573_03815 [Candidatus Woesearchaeota archaeon]|nr:MAG: hypothetical protein C4573_03815 [Candidatus Woesearchaeota archaeon]